MGISTLRRLFAHLRWADAAARRSLAGAAAERRASDLYLHVLGAEAVWLARIEGRTAAAGVWPDLDPAAAAALAARTGAAYEALLAGLAEADLARPIAYTNSAGQAFTSRLEDILLHVALHGAYHRGQIALRVREAGGEPASTDYIAFVRGAPAARTPR